MNSIAIVTGASQGIGRSTAVRLARDFSAIALAARDAGALTEVAEIVRAAGAEPLVCALDLSKVDSAGALVNKTVDRFGRIDALLNIAGAVPQIDLFEMTDEQWRAGTELKLHGARRLTILTWRQTFLSVVTENPGDTFYHASAGEGVIVLYSRDADKGLWYLPGSGLGPLSEGGRQLMKEAIAAGPHR